MCHATLQRVQQIIASVTGLDPDQRMDANTQLVGMGLALDSAAVLELLVAIEKEFRIQIEAEELRQAEGLATVGALADFVESRMPAGQGQEKESPEQPT